MTSYIVLDLHLYILIDQTVSHICKYMEDLFYSILDLDCHLFHLIWHHKT